MTDRINIGDTVEVRAPIGDHRWRGEVLDFVSAPTLGAARVLCIDADAHSGMSMGLVGSVAVDRMTRVGDPAGVRADGCDDVDVTGRVRPYHRHAVTGEAHAHPGGGTPHTHQTPEQATNGLVRPLVSGEGGADMTPVVTSFQVPLPQPLYDFHTRGQHHAEVKAIEAGDLVGTDSLTVFAVLRDIADNEPVRARTDGWLRCWYCEASSLPPPGRPQPVAHLISCPWRRVVEIVGVRPDQEVPTAPPVVCRCGHLESAHETQGWRACSYRDGCGCQLFTDREQTILPGDDFDPGDRGWVDE